MRRLDRVNLVLALLLAALLWANRQPPIDPAPPLTGLDPAQVSEIRVLRAEHLQLALLRDTQGWMLTHPDVQRARPQRVNTLLGLLQAPVRWRLQGSPADLARFGLDHPVLTLSFDATQVHFGAASSPPGQRYVALQDRVVLIDEAYFRIAGLPAQHFHERR
jgi:hypothetical protein